jgi:translation initiation factor 2B subunit (eIF-2B alpha/beta/delta family)
MTRLAAILLGLLALGLAACGGDDAPSREEFADRANEICRDAERALEDVAEGAQSPREVADAVDQVIEESRSAVDELADLERPEGEGGETAERFVDTTRTDFQEKIIPALEELRDAVESSEREAIREAEEKIRAIDTDESNSAARDVGATACGEE